MSSGIKPHYVKRIKLVVDVVTGNKDAVMVLSPWLKDLGLHHIADSLEEFGVTTVRELSVLRDSELRDIVNELDLSKRQKIKFIVAIRKFEIHEVPRVVLTQQEDKAMKRLANLTKEARTALTEVESTMEAVRQNARNSRKDISSEFSTYQTQLKERENNLLKEVSKMEQEKLDALGKQSSELANAIAELTRNKMESDKLLRISSVEEMSLSEKSVAANVAKVVEFKFPRKPAVNAHVTFEKSSRVFKQEINKYGRVSSFAPAKPPVITKLVPKPDSIEITWELNSEPGTPDKFLPIGFGVRVTELSSTSQEGSSGIQTEFEIEGKECEYVVKDLKSATKYSIAVRSKNKFGWTQYGKLSHVKTLKQPVPKVRTPSAKGKRWTLEMSHKHPLAENTYEALVDVSTTQTGATTYGVYIMAVFDKPSLVSSVTVSGYGNARYVNGSHVQCYIDGEYKDIVRVDGVQNNQMKTFDFPPVITNKVRLFRSFGYYLATGHFIIA